MRANFHCDFPNVTQLYSEHGLRGDRGIQKMNTLRELRKMYMDGETENFLRDAISAVLS